MGANFFRTVDMIVSNLAANPLVLTLPIGGEDNFQVRSSCCAGLDFDAAVSMLIVGPSIHPSSSKHV